MSVNSFWGVGLRPHHYPQWHDRKEDLPTLEVLSDNYIYQNGGPARAHLKRIVDRAPCLMHSVGLNIGGAYDLDEAFVKELKLLSEIVRPKVISDHICFSRTPSANSYDLLPVLRSEWNLNRIAERVERVQDILNHSLTLENVSSYVEYEEDEMSEFEFLNELADKTGCGILLDVNNIFVSGFNHGFDPWEEIQKIKPKHVRQYHLAGHSEREGFFFDTHDQPVKKDVWKLMELTWNFVGPRPGIIERDDDDVPFGSLMEERSKAVLVCEKGNG